MVLTELSCNSTVNVRMASLTKFYSCIVFVCLKHSTLSQGGYCPIILQNEIWFLKYSVEIQIMKYNAISTPCPAKL